MRIHTDTLTRLDVLDAVRAAGADVATLTEHASRSRVRAFNVLLTGSSRRRPQGGSREAYAATWDQWGIFLAYLYAADATLVTPYYSSAENFSDRTADRFGAPEVTMTSEGYRNVFEAYGRPDDEHGDHVFRFSGTVGQQQCTRCTAVQRWSFRD